MNLTVKLLLLAVAICLFIICAVETAEQVNDSSDLDGDQEGYEDEYPLLNLLDKLVASRQRDTRNWRSNPKFRNYKAHSAGWKRAPLADDTAHQVDERRYNSGRYSGYGCQGNRCSAGWKRTSKTQDLS
ncbi:hypothetical protein BSL78_17349 [Apostichopus japonicus]|uniref:Np23 n=1 Tax=Stichopus japonicus TaxID=307972 RepID=A0A2G8KCP5_STIJA|nr:np23 precursor [Apostichopus japonicus]PIK45777.1 hypothetical protein BSL78_17349 [Apostichopus japonicus]